MQPRCLFRGRLRHPSLLAYLGVVAAAAVGIACSDHTASFLAPSVVHSSRIGLELTSSTITGQVVGARATPVQRQAASVPFVLLGRNAHALLPLQNASLFTWVLLIFLPGWRHTRKLALVVPILHSCLYVAVFAHMIANPVPGLKADFATLSGIMALFSSADGVFAGWLHYCVFDPLVGLGEVLHARMNRVPHLLVIPCLVLTMLAGPAGFLSYLVLASVTRLFRQKTLKSFLMDED